VTVVDPGWIRPQPGWLCAECGFDYDACTRENVAETVRGFGRRYRVPLTRGLAGEDLDALLRAHPFPDRWSALEYACHARDAFALSNHRIKLVLAEDRPMIVTVHRDEAVSASSYKRQEPLDVADEIASASERLATRLGGVTGDGWQREGVSEYPNLSVQYLAANAVHEGVHHLLDIGRTLRAARGR
jgi:hypothetical protein